MILASSPTINAVAAGPVLGDLSTVNNTDIIVGTITLDSSGTNAFTLLIASDTQGGKPKSRLVRNVSGIYQNPRYEGNYCDYTIDLVPLVVGSLGCTAPLLPNNTAVSPNIELVYTHYNSPTAGYQYNVRINTLANSKLFRGIFKDILTITITDNL